MMRLNNILRNTTYDDSLFQGDVIATVESAIFTKTVKGIEPPYNK